MSLELNQTTIEMLEQFHLPTYKEIPDVGLYLDQTSKIINQYLEAIPDCAITNSMISNYVKHKLIANPIKKQYYRDQIAYLIFISIIKSTVALENIAALFEIQTQTYSVEKAYNYFVEQFELYLDAELHHKNVSYDDSTNENKQLLASIIKIVVSQIVLEERFKTIKQKEN